MNAPTLLETNLPQRTPTMDFQQAAAAYMANFENIIAPGKEIVMTKEFKPRMAHEFDRYHTPQSLKQSVLRSEKIQKIIEHYAHESKCSTSKIEKQVKEILDEIGLDRNLAIIRWCGMAITAIAKRIYAGIYVNKESMDKVKQSFGPNPVLYLPSHRSYMDFILMAYIAFYYDIELPGVAAGMDFHSMFAMGTMLRKTGAFFMRRSFSNDELYWDIFREYMYALVVQYHTGVEFFIEGTRSRNFKALVPKIGLLSMALLPYFTGEVSDITVVPVSVSYERVLEEQLFVYELLGVPKPKESTKGFFKAMKIIDESFGKMYLDFGTPISAREFFGHNTNERPYQRAAVGSHLQKLNKNEIELVKKLANEAIYQQQRGIVVSTFNFVCLYFACELYSTRNVNIDEMSRGVCRLKTLFEALGAHVATNLNHIKHEIIETVEIHSNILHFRKARLHFTEIAAAQLQQAIDPKRLKAHALNPHTMAIAVPALSLQLYINPCLFWLARPAYLILTVLQINKEVPGMVFSSFDDLLAEIYKRVSVLDETFKHEFIIESGRETEEFQRHLKILSSFGVFEISTVDAKIIVNENECCSVILSALAPFLCVYYQLTTTLNELANKTRTFTSKDVLIHMQQRIETALQSNNEIAAANVHPYCLALDNLNIALNSLIQAEYIVKNKDNGGNLEMSTLKSLKSLEKQLLQFCQLMPFQQYYEPSTNTDTDTNSSAAQLCRSFNAETAITVTSKFNTSTLAIFTKLFDANITKILLLNLMLSFFLPINRNIFDLSRLM